MLLSLDQLATKHGQLAPEVVDGGRYGWKHRVADVLHGWSVHDYHHQADPVLLSDEDYLEALKAAENGLHPHHPAKPEVPDYAARVAKALADARAAAEAHPLPSEPVRDVDLPEDEQTEAFPAIESEKL